MADYREGSSCPSFFVPKIRFVSQKWFSSIRSCSKDEIQNPENLYLIIIGGCLAAAGSLRYRKGVFMSKKVMKRFFSLFTAVMILSMTFLDCFWYKPMQAYAASIELPWDSGAWGSIVADLLGAFGGSAAKSLTSATTAVEFGSYLEKRRVEVLEEESDLSYEERLAKVFPFLYKDNAGSTKTLEVTGRDYVESHEMMNKIKSTVADTFQLPISFIRSFQSFLVDKLNFNAADGSAVSAVYTMEPAQYFDVILPRAGFPIKAKNDSFYVTADCTVWINTTYSNAICFLGPSGGHLYRHHTNGDVITVTFKSSNSGFSLTDFYYTAGHADSLVIDGWDSSWPGISSTDITKKNFYIVDYTYSTPSIDTSFSDAKAITWTGSADLKTTLANQAAADDLKAYIDSIFTATLNPDIPDESESSGTGEGEGDVTLTGIASWLQKIFNGILALPGNIASAFDSALVNIGTKIDAIPSVLADIRDKIISIPDNIGKELAKLGDWLQTIPGALADIKDQVIAVPKSIGAEISAFFAIDTTRINNSYSDMTNALKAKLSAINQIIDIFDKTNYSFSDTPPVFTMQTPDALKQAVQSDTIVIMDLTKYADAFYWCRTILSAVLWVAFGKWVLDQFDVQFHVG